VNVITILLNIFGRSLAIEKIIRECNNHFIALHLVYYSLSYIKNRENCTRTTVQKHLCAKKEKEKTSEELLRN